MRRRRGSPLRRWPRWGALFSALLLGAAALAQPYAADGGFERPRLQLEGNPRPLATLGVDQGVAQLIYLEEGSLWRAEHRGDGSLGAPVALAADVLPRTLSASSQSSGPLHLAWSERDLETGRFVTSSTLLKGTESAAQPLPSVLLAGAEEPLLLTHRARGGGSELLLLREGAPVEVLYRTQLSIDGLSASRSGGVLQLTWLEGITEIDAFGRRDDWSAMALDIATTGDASVGADRAATRLGAADGTLRTTLTASAEGGAVRAFRDRRGSIQVVLSPELPALEALAGQPIALLSDQQRLTLYAMNGDRVLRWELPDGATSAAEAAMTPVLWAPVVVQQAAAVRDGDGIDHLLVRGTLFGGDDVLYSSSNAQPMRRTLSDELAALFGWRPWSWVEEATGQLLSALLAAVLVATSGLPLLWLGAALWARRDPDRAALRGSLLGAAIGPVGFAGAFALGADGASLLTLMGGWGALVGVASASLLGGVLALRRRDLEALPAFVLAGALALGMSAAGHLFVAFPAWSALAWW